jgi:hypothetical protein
MNDKTDEKKDCENSDIFSEDDDAIIKSPLKAIRAKCLDDCGDSHKEVRDCPVGNKCALYPFRFGKNPFRKKRELTEEQRQEMIDRMALAREARSQD